MQLGRGCITLAIRIFEESGAKLGKQHTAYSLVDEPDVNISFLYKFCKFWIAIARSLYVESCRQGLKGSFSLA